MPDELVNTITQHGFHFGSSSLQDSCNMALSQMVLHMGYIFQDFYAHS